MLDSSHQRVARAFEADPDIALIAIEIDRELDPPADTSMNPKEFAYSLSGGEVAAILALSPAVSGSDQLSPKSSGFLTTRRARRGAIGVISSVSQSTLTKAGSTSGQLGGHQFGNPQFLG